MAGENSANVVHLESYIHVIFSNCILNKLGWSSKKCEEKKIMIMIEDIKMRILLTYIIYTSSTVALVVKIYIWRKSGLKLIEK